jgi:DNA gyrase subunit A
VREIQAILGDRRKLWRVVRSELQEVASRFADKRRTRIGGRAAQEAEYSEEAFIVDEDCLVLLSADGWIKRVGRIGDVSKVRLRQGDELQEVVAGNTKASVVFFTSHGSAYTLRINDVPAARGFGDPIQKFFKFRDGERVVRTVSLDPRAAGDIGKAGDPEGVIPPNHLLAVASSGYVLRQSLVPFVEPSIRGGRKYVRLREGEQVAGVHVVRTGDVLMLASAQGRVLLFPTDEVSFLAGAGRGVKGIRLQKGDRVLGSAVSRGRSDCLTVVTTRGGTIHVTPRRYQVTSRGGKGVEVIKRGGLARIEKPAVAVPDLGGAPLDAGDAPSASDPTANGTPPGDPS